MQGMSNAPPTLMSAVPMGFRQIGMPIHMAFEKLANAAEKGATSMEILSGLGEAMNRCVSCHAAYRIEAEQP
jgi:cytochrome c556